MTSKQVYPQETVGFNVKFVQLVGCKDFEVKIDASSLEDLKCQIELSSGIPADLLNLYHNGSPVNDCVSSIFQTNNGLTSENIVVKLSPEWEHFIKTCTKSENYHVVRRRSRVKMQVLTQEERIFVASFVAARHSNSALLFGILPCNKSIEKTTKLSKRNILHAAVHGGDKNCIVNILMHGGGRLINKKDVNGETPLSMAKDMKDVADMLNAYYMMMTKQSSTVQEEQYLTNHNHELSGSSDEENNQTEDESSIDETNDESSHTSHNDSEEILASCEVTASTKSNPKEELLRQQSPDSVRNDENSKDFSEMTSDKGHTALHLYDGRQAATVDLSNLTEIELRAKNNCTDSNKNNLQSSRRRKMGLPSFHVLPHFSNHDVESSAVKETTTDVTGVTVRDLLAPKPPASPVPERRRVTNIKYLDSNDGRLITTARQRSFSTSYTPNTRLLNRDRERTRVCSESSKEENTPRHITFQQWLVNKNEQKRKASLSIPKEKDRRLSLGSPVLISPKTERKLSIPTAISISHGNTCERSSEAFKTWLHKKDEEALERDLKLLSKVISRSNERKKEDILLHIKTNKRRSSKADKYWRF